MSAKLIYKDKIIISDEIICEMIIWQLPVNTKERPHGLKYRLHCGYRNGKCLVRYDNEHGKGDHRHYADVEEIYKFESVEKLLSDFIEDVKKTTWEKQ